MEGPDLENDSKRRSLVHLIRFHSCHWTACLVFGWSVMCQGWFVVSLLMAIPQVLSRCSGLLRPPQWIHSWWTRSQLMFFGTWWSPWTYSITRWGRKICLRWQQIQGQFNRGIDNALWLICRTIRGPVVGNTSRVFNWLVFLDRFTVEPPRSSLRQPRWPSFMRVRWWCSMISQPKRWKRSWCWLARQALPLAQTPTWLLSLARTWSRTKWSLVSRFPVTRSRTGSNVLLRPLLVVGVAPRSVIHHRCSLRSIFLLTVYVWTFTCRSAHR